MGCFTTPLKFTPLQEVSDGILQDFVEQHLDISMRSEDLYLQHLRSPSRSRQHQLEPVELEVQAYLVLQEPEFVPEPVDSGTVVLQMKEPAEVQTYLLLLDMDHLVRRTHMCNQLIHLGLSRSVHKLYALVTFLLVDLQLHLIADLLLLNYLQSDKHNHLKLQEHQHRSD